MGMRTLPQGIQVSYYFDVGDLVLEDLQEVFDIVYDVQSKWYSIGVELRIETSVLDAIKVEFNGVPEECLFQMLRHWLKQLPLPTMREMIQALGSEPIGEKHLSLSLRRKVYGEQYPTKGKQVNLKVWNRGLATIKRQDKDDVVHVRQ